MLGVPQNHPGRKQRGRGCCAISSLPIPSSFASASLFRMLSPTIPVHPRNSPVSPIIPVHTQKQGGGGHNEAKEVKEVKEAENNRAFLTPAFTTTSIAIVGAPTFLGLARLLSFLRLFLNLKLTTDHSKLSKSNYSRAYAKTGGGGCLPQKAFSCNPFVFCGHVNHSVKYNCRRADIFIPASHRQVPGAARHITDRATKAGRINPRPQTGVSVPQEGGTQDPGTHAVPGAPGSDTQRSI
jgi:hypothetical protein